MEDIKICGKSLAEANAAFLAKYPTDDAQIDYYTDLAKEIFKEFQIDGSFKTKGVRKNVEEWYNNKKKQMELFRKHPYWSEEAKAIVFTQAEKREIDYSKARSQLAYLYHYIRDKKYVNLDFIAYIHGALNNIENQTTDINEDFLKYLKTHIRRNQTKIPKRIESMLTVGTKISKLVYKFCTMVPDGEEAIDVTKLVDEHEPDDRSFNSFDKYYAKFADCLSELNVNKLTVISLHFCDFMTMSNGNSWSSCHYINSHNLFHEGSESYEGSYKQGCLSYALDEPSFLLYTLPDTYAGNKYYREPKLARMCCQYQNGVLITGKCYPDNSINTIDHYRQILQQIISATGNVPNLWTFSRDVNKIENFVKTHDNASHYPDYIYSKQKPTISICRNSLFELDDTMVIGNQAYCLNCGMKLYSGSTGWLQCEKHRKSMFCTGCGCLIEDGDMHEINDQTYCKDCVFYCDHHKRYELNTDKHGEINTNHGKITVCKKAFKQYVKCDNCETYLLYTDKECVNCHTSISIKVTVEEISREYKVGDYILVGNVENCRYGFNEGMEECEGRIAKITHRRSTGSYRIRCLREEWSWDDSCFKGIVHGANDEMIGIKISDIINEGE